MQKDQNDNAIQSAVSTVMGNFYSAKNNYNQFNKGDISSLRRMNVGDPPVSFWKFMANTSNVLNEKTERRWALIVKSMALMSEILNGGAGVTIGSAARKAKFSANSDIRISRLLKSEGEEFERYVESFVRYMSSKNIGYDWYQFSLFILSPKEDQRRIFARDFYS